MRRLWLAALLPAAPAFAVTVERAAVPAPEPVPVQMNAAAVPSLPALPALPEAAAWPALLEQAQQTTGPLVEKALAARQEGTTVKAVLAAKDTKTITEYHGVPSRVSELQTVGEVYRHWVLDEKDLPAILASRALKAGQTAYVEFTGSSRAYIKDIYPDLRGVFFTAPQNAASDPRVLNQSTPHYVDFRLPPGVRALSLDGKTVMMVPAQPGTMIPVEIVGSSRDSR